MMRFSCDRGVYNLHIGWIDACWQFCAVLGNIRPILAALVVFQLNISGYKIKACYAPGFRLKRRGDWSAASASTAICENSLWKVMNDQCCCKCAINIGHGWTWGDYTQTVTASDTAAGRTGADAAAATPPPAPGLRVLCFIFPLRYSILLPVLLSLSIRYPIIFCIESCSHLSLDLLICCGRKVWTGFRQPL